MLSLANASAGIVKIRITTSASNGWILPSVTGKVMPKNNKRILTRYAGMIFLACLYPKTKVFLKVCRDGMSEKLTFAK